MLSETQNNQPTSFACDMTVFSGEQRTIHQQLIGQLFGSLLRERGDLHNGYSYRFDSEQYGLVADFIANERLCCPFLTFRLDVAPNHGPLWLQITGDGDLKPLLRGLTEGMFED